jgi:hypothetical protein
MSTEPTRRPTTVDHQLDPAWLEWMTQRNDRLQIFFSCTVPDMPYDKYSTAGIRTAETALLRRYPTLDAAAPDDAVLVDFSCYLGEVFVQSLDAYWINDPFPSPAPRATIHFPYSEVRLCVYEQVVLALHHRTGTRWSGIYAALSAQCATWWESGHSTR